VLTLKSAQGGRSGTVFDLMARSKFIHMHLFSTVLFVNGNPVGYEVFRESERLKLNPAENPNREIVPPVIVARNNRGTWEVEGTSDRDLIDQVIEDISLNNSFLPRQVLSAAP
jgi:hypothetical protein